jgi:hypothetical protein
MLATETRQYSFPSRPALQAFFMSLLLIRTNEPADVQTWSSSDTA